MSRAAAPSQTRPTARSRVARASPTLPPSASTASVMARAKDLDAHVAERRRDRSVRLVHRHAHAADARELPEQSVGDRAGGGFDQPVGPGAERLGRLVGVARLGKVDVGREIERERLAHLGLVRHHAVIGVQRQSGHEDAVVHDALPIAAVTRSACTVSATSWTRTIVAPLRTARRCAAIEPPSRWSGDDGTTVLMKRLRDAPTRSGRPKLLNDSSRAITAMLCSGVLPKPTPGSSTT